MRETTSSGIESIKFLNRVELNVGGSIFVTFRFERKMVGEIWPIRGKEKEGGRI